MNQRSTQRWGFEWVVTTILQLLIVTVILFQTLSIYTFPQPDGARWWGDETTQILELKSELHDGYAHIPTGLGSSVAITNGIVRGNSWMAAIIYGVPATILSHFTSYKDLVEIGRFVTLLLSILLYLLASRVLYGFNVQAPLRLVAVLLLISSRSFFYASHAARLDVAAGLSVLGFVWYLTERYNRIQRGECSQSARWFFWYGCVALLFVTLSIHLLTLLGLLSIYALWRFGTFRHPRHLLAAAGGVIFVSGVLLSIYALSGAPWTLFGPTTKPNQFESVASMLPIQRLFSRSVQVANILERVSGLWKEAPAFLMLCLYAMATGGIALRQHWRKLLSKPAPNFLPGATLTVLIAWLLFQSPALYYYIHVLPLLIVALVVRIAPRIKAGISSTIAVLVFGVLISIASVADSLHIRRVAGAIAHDNHHELDGAVTAMRLDSPNPVPLVLAQNPAIAYLEQRTDLRLMTAHIVSFPTSNSPLAASLQNLGVDYLLLYASHSGIIYSEDYATLRPIADSIGTLIWKNPGVLFDVNRNYFDSRTLESLPKDTLLLYRLRRNIAR